jgi:hypothetical protein
MAKKNEIVGVDGQRVAAKSVPVIKDVIPCGSQVLVELLTAQEALGTILQIESDASITGAPQGYVRKKGPRVSDDWGFAVGDRVTLHGNYTPVSENVERENSHRPWILVEPNQIKAILKED